MTFDSIRSPSTAVRAKSARRCLKQVGCSRFAVAIGIALLATAQHPSCAEETSTENAASSADQAAPRGPLRSSTTQVGKASVYGSRFAGRKMADGSRMDPHANAAASKTLPLGSSAKVTNLETGQSAVVTIQDRGPYVRGRILDLSPATADKIGIPRRQGVAKVEVAPVEKPSDTTVSGAMPRSPVAEAEAEQPR